MTWTPERTVLLLEMRARGADTPTMAKALSVTRGSIAGKLSRLEGRYVDDRRKTKPPAYTPHIRGDWDYRTFEPYAIRKQRLAQERANGLR